MIAKSPRSQAWLESSTRSGRHGLDYRADWGQRMLVTWLSGESELVLRYGGPPRDRD